MSDKGAIWLDADERQKLQCELNKRIRGMIASVIDRTAKPPQKTNGETTY